MVPDWTTKGSLRVRKWKATMHTHTHTHITRKSTCTITRTRKRLYAYSLINWQIHAKNRGYSMKEVYLSITIRDFSCQVRMQAICSTLELAKKRWWGYSFIYNSLCVARAKCRTTTTPFTQTRQHSWGFTRYVGQSNWGVFDAIVWFISMIRRPCNLTCGRSAKQPIRCQVTSISHL
jgi:hypothetical protein